MLYYTPLYLVLLLTPLSDEVALRIERRTSDREVAGSTHARALLT